MVEGRRARKWVPAIALWVMVWLWPHGMTAADGYVSASSLRASQSFRDTPRSEAALRFRPDELASPYVPQGDLQSSDPHAAFRPLEKRRRPTYEEREAREAPPPPMLPPPLLPYPFAAPSLPGQGGYWR